MKQKKYYNLEDITTKLKIKEGKTFLLEVLKKNARSGNPDNKLLAIWNLRLRLRLPSQRRFLFPIIEINKLIKEK